MATVPTYDSFRVSANTLPVGQVGQISAPAGNTNIGRDAQQMGQAIAGAGQHLGAIATKAQEQANQVRIDDAMNRLKEEALRLTFDPETGYTNLRGLSALERPDGKPLTEEYSGALSRFASEIESSLGNELQRAAFMRAADGVMVDFGGRLLKHESDEFRTYAMSVSEGVQATALREISLSWDNPEAIDKAVHRIRAHTARQAQLMGKSAEWQEAQVRSMVSTAHATALTAALEHNAPLYADSYLNRYAGEMEAGDILRVQSQITKSVDLQVGSDLGAQVFAGFAPEIAPDDMTRLTRIVMGIESGGRRFDANGELLEGPQTRYGTAKGEMQVLDGTNSDPGFGVAPARDDSPDERARVGRDYLAAMVREYKGNVPMALAAYNWGPGNVDAAVKKHGTNWLAHAPAETQNYVVSAVKQFGSGQGKSPTPSLREMKAALREQPELANNPDRLRYAEAAVESNFKALKEEVSQREMEATQSAYEELYANGGSIEALPPEIRMAVPGDKLPSLMAFAERIRKSGGTEHNPRAWAAILSMPSEALSKMTPLQFYDEFRPVLDDQHLEKGYALLNEAKGVVDEKHTEIISVANRVKNAAIIAGILPDSGTPSQSQVEEFTKFQLLVDERVRDFERTDLQGQRRANSEEVQRIIDGVFMDKVFTSRWYWSDKEETVALMDTDDLQSAYVKVDGESVPLGSIPMSERAKIIPKLQARGLPVTEQAIAELWVRAGKPK